MLTIRNPWELAYASWGRAIITSTIIYVVAFAFFGGIDNAGFALLIGFAAFVLSWPAVFALRLLLPKVLLIKSRARRIGLTMSAITGIFLLIALPASIALSLGHDDAYEVQVQLRSVLDILGFTAPFWLGALIATSYTCRT